MTQESIDAKKDMLSQHFVMHVIHFRPANLKQYKMNSCILAKVTYKKLLCLRKSIKLAGLYIASVGCTKGRE